MDKLSSAKDQLTEHVNSLSDKMSNLQEEASSKLDEMLQTTSSHQEELGGGLQNILQEIIQSQVDDMVNEMTAKVNGELKDLLDQTMDHVKEVLGEAGRAGVRRHRPEPGRPGTAGAALRRASGCWLPRTCSSTRSRPQPASSASIFSSRSAIPERLARVGEITEVSSG